MELTTEKLRASMNLTEDQMKALLETLQIPDVPDRLLTSAELRAVQMYLLRAYPVPVQARPEPGKQQPLPGPSQAQEPVKSAEPVKTAEPVKPAEPVGPVDPELERLVLEKKIMIDTCSLMHDKCALFVEKLLPALRKHGKKVVVPAKVIAELKKHQKNKKDPFRAAAAVQGLALCMKLRQAECLSIRGADRDNFADNTFFVAISGYRYKYSILPITQDRKLGQDVLRLNEMRSTRGYPVAVCYLNGRGELCPSSPAR